MSQLYHFVLEPCQQEDNPRTVSVPEVVKIVRHQLIVAVKTSRVYVLQLTSWLALSAHILQPTEDFKMIL